MVRGAGACRTGPTHIAMIASAGAKLARMNVTTPERVMHKAVRLRVFL